MNVRDRILRRLRSVSVDLPQFVATTPLPVVRASTEECVARFVLEAEALGIDCLLEPSADDVRRRLSALTRGKRVLSWDRARLPYDAWGVLENPILGSDERDRQAAAEIGVTGCDVAIAETGSLVLFSAPGQSRTVSLLPSVHVAILERSRLCFSMAEMFATHAQRLSEEASCTIITGPSRTADIELTLTLGIHGPGQVIVIVGP